MLTQKSLAVLALAAVLLSSATRAQSDCDAPPAPGSEPLVKRALACNPGQLALDARVRAQAEHTAASGHLDDPKLMLGVAPRTLGQEEMRKGYVVEVSQSLPWPGVLELRRALEEAGADSRAFEYDQGAVQLALALRLAYADWHYRERLIAINRRHQSLWQTFVDSSRARYAAGSGGKAAVLQARHEEHQLHLDELALTQAAARDRSRLARLANIDPSGLSASTPLPQREPPAGSLTLALDSLDTQPQLQQLAAEETRKSRELELAEKDRYPNFSVLARHNNQWANPDQRLFVGVGFNLPLDIGGKRSARERSLEAERLAVEWQRRDAALALADALRRAESRHREASDTLGMYRRDLLPLAEESLATARDDFAAGRGDFLTLLVAERNLLKVQRGFETAERDRFAALAQLTAAAGLVMLEDWNLLAGGGK